MLVPVPADSPTVWTPVSTVCVPVVPPSPTLAALTAPSISRLNLPLSVAGTSFLVTLMVPVGRGVFLVFVNQHLTCSYQWIFRLTVPLARSLVTSDEGLTAEVVVTALA